MRVLRAGICCGLLASAALFAADWPQYRGPNHDGLSGESISAEWPKEGPKRLWKTNVGVGNAPVSIRGGRVYTSGHAGAQDQVLCLKAESGEVIWKYEFASELFDTMHE